VSKIGGGLQNVGCLPSKWVEADAIRLMGDDAAKYGGLFCCNCGGSLVTPLVEG
jgi:hypothetical protein